MDARLGCNLDEGAAPGQQLHKIADDDLHVFSGPWGGVCNLLRNSCGDKCSSNSRAIPKCSPNGPQPFW